ncbi:pyridoxal 5'-phosphate synthase glutaminase subunit PdxT [Exiguobacterium artemiae]|uniref:pyridoxal 5'-phosphate synthase glutaminase subunit PdxT n=1 Tax=Exiguobacterium sp. S22-S28 TaxID=3342768 RepID=UPI00372D80ED
MVIGILGVQGAVREHEHILRTLDVETVVVKSVDDLDGIDGLVLPGGESTTMRRLIDRYGLLDVLRSKVTTLPMFGTCAGMILLASELSEGPAHLQAIPMTVRRNAFGRQVDSFETMLAVEGVGQDVEAIFIRAPFVEQIGNETRVLSQVSGAVVAVETNLHLACSFHPELTSDQRMHQYFLEKIKQHQAISVG